MVVAESFTKRLCDAAEAHEEPYILWAGDPAGFGLRVQPSGHKSFVLKYRASGRQRWLTLGAYGVLTVDQARKLARGALADVAKGGDPAADKSDARQAPTVRDLCERFTEEHMPKLKPKTTRPYQRLIDDRILKHFGPVKLDGVSRGDVVKWHHGMRATPIEANRALLLLHKLFAMAALWEWHAGPNPAQGVPKNTETARERSVTGVELYRIAKAIGDLERTAKRPLSPYLALAFRLLLLTGCRKDEILTLAWEHVDTDAGVLRLQDSKSGRKTVVLSAAAVDLLKRAPRMTGSPWVATRQHRDADGEWQHVVSVAPAWARVLAEASTKQDGEPDVNVSDLHLHDLRHGYASTGASAGLSLPIIGALLGHADQASTNRYSHLQTDPLKVAADLIGGEIWAAMNGTPAADVVNLDEARNRTG
jgi:integrase